MYRTSVKERVQDWGLHFWGEGGWARKSPGHLCLWNKGEKGRSPERGVGSQPQRSHRPSLQEMGPSSPRTGPKVAMTSLPLPPSRPRGGTLQPWAGAGVGGGGASRNPRAGVGGAEAGSGKAGPG